MSALRILHEVVLRRGASNGMGGFAKPWKSFSLGSLALLVAVAAAEQGGGAGAFGRGRGFGHAEPANGRCRRWP